MSIKSPDIILIPLQPEDREQFIQDNQRAFKYGAQHEFGMRDERCEEGEEVISRKTIEDSIDRENAEAYRIVLDGKKVGGVVLSIDKEADKGGLELLFVLPEVHSKGIGQPPPGRRLKRCIRKSRSGKPSPHTSRSGTSIST